MTALLVLLPLISASCGQTHNGNLNSAEDSDGNDGVLNPTDSFFSAVVENTESTSDIPVGIEFDEDKYIDFFADVNDWLKYNGGDGYGIASLEIPEDYVREIGDGCYLRYQSDGQISVVCNNEHITTIGYIVDKSAHGVYSKLRKENLSEGDTFSISIEPLGSAYINDVNVAIAETGKSAFEISRNYVYPYTGDYIKEKDEISEEHLDAIEEYVISILEEEGFDDIKINSIDFGVIKPAGIGRDLFKSLHRSHTAGGIISLCNSFICIGMSVTDTRPYMNSIGVEYYLSGLAVRDGELVFQYEGYEAWFEKQHISGYKSDSITREYDIYSLNID